MNGPEDTSDGFGGICIFLQSNRVDVEPAEVFLVINEEFLDNLIHG